MTRGKFVTESGRISGEYPDAKVCATFAEVKNLMSKAGKLEPGLFDQVVGYGTTDERIVYRRGEGIPVPKERERE